MNISIDPAAWQRLWAYTDYQIGEVACFGYATADGPDVFIDEVFIVPQQASKAEVDFMTYGLPFAIEKAALDGRLEDLRFCWHSHGDFATQFSATDQDMIEKMGLTSPWFVSVIFNKQHSMNGRIDVFDVPPFGRTHVTYKDVDVCEALPEAYEDQILKDLEKYVKPTPPPPKTAPKRKWDPVQKKMVDVVPASSPTDDIDEYLKRHQVNSVEELAEALEWFPVIENGMKMWVSVNTGSIMHIESPMNYDDFNKMAWGDVIDADGVEIDDDEMAQLAAAIATGAA